MCTWVLCQKNPGYRILGPGERLAYVRECVHVCMRVHMWGTLAYTCVLTCVLMCMHAHTC